VVSLNEPSQARSYINSPAAREDLRYNPVRNSDPAARENFDDAFLDTTGVQ
jgi:hypothetical protein